MLLTATKVTHLELVSGKMRWGKGRRTTKKGFLVVEPLRVPPPTQPTP